jgi:galactose mutarotase-like enzyme
MQSSMQFRLQAKWISDRAPFDTHLIACSRQRGKNYKYCWWFRFTEDGVAGAEENVVIQAGDCVVTLLPQLGGKIASILVGQPAGKAAVRTELLQAPLNPYALRSRGMAFSESDASGWDECLPSVAECVVSTDKGLVTVPDHGDLWRVPWEVLAATPDSVTMRGSCFSLPLDLMRSMILTELDPGTSSGWRLQLLYTLTNHGDFPAPWSWAVHPLFATEEGDRIVLPPSVKEVKVEGSNGNRLGANGDTVAWPVARLADGTKADLSVVQSETSSIGDKLFVEPLAAYATSAEPLQQSNNWCALERPSVGLRLTVRFDAELTPYTGLWLCYGGWPDGNGKKQVCVAMEPATAPVDSLAITGPWSRTLAAGETFSWSMELQIDRIPKHKKA